MSAATAQADTYKCFETAEQAIQAGRAQYGVIATAGKRIGDPDVVGDAEYAYKAHAQVLSRDPESGDRWTTQRSINTVILVSDVAYMIEAWESKGIKFTMFLDELDQTSMSLRGVRGQI